MKMKVLTLLLLSLSLSGCIVEPGGYGYRGERDHERGDFHSDHETHRGW